MKLISGKKALVTGAASGIGRAIALELAREGADLFLLDVDSARLEATAQEARSCGVEVVAAVCDLSDPAQINSTISHLRAVWDHLDILVNNAGTAYYGATHLMTDEQWRRILSINLLAPTQLIHALLPKLLSAREAHILNVCSFLGLAPWRNTAAYQMTKYGLVGLTAALRAEYSGTHLGATALCPGFVETELLRKVTTAQSALRKCLLLWVSTTPEHVARKAVKAIRRNQARVVVTPFAHVYWRLGQLCPRLLEWLARQNWKRMERLARNPRRVTLRTK